MCHNQKSSRIEERSRRRESNPHTKDDKAWILPLDDGGSQPAGSHGSRAVKGALPMRGMAASRPRCYRSAAAVAPPLASAITGAHRAGIASPAPRVGGKACIGRLGLKRPPAEPAATRSEEARGTPAAKHEATGAPGGRAPARTRNSQAL